MPFISLSGSSGYLAVGTTAVRLTANQAVPGADLPAHTIFVQQHPDNTGILYLMNARTAIPTSDFNVSTGVGVVAILLPPTTVTSLAFIAYTVPYAPGGLNTADYYLIASASSQKAVVSVIQA